MRYLRLYYRISFCNKSVSFFKFTNCNLRILICTSFTIIIRPCKLYEFCCLRKIIHFCTTEICIFQLISLNLQTHIGCFCVKNVLKSSFSICLFQLDYLSPLH